MVYEGPPVVKKIKSELAAILKYVELYAIGKMLCKCVCVCVCV